MASILDAIAEGRTAEPPAPAVAPVAAPEGRLTTANYIVTLFQLGTLIDSAAGAFRKLPDAAPRDVDALLCDIAKTAAGIGVKANRLLSANR